MRLFSPQNKAETQQSQDVAQIHLVISFHDATDDEPSDEVRMKRQQVLRMCLGRFWNKKNGPKRWNLKKTAIFVPKF